MFLQWLDSVRREFRTLMTGSLLLVAMGFAQGLWRVPIPRWCYVAVTSGFLMWAFYRSWLKEHLALEAAQAELGRLRDPFLGLKWDNFLSKIETLNAMEKYLLQKFVLQGCRMLDSQGQQIVADRYHCVMNCLDSIHRKTGFITTGFNGWEANQGLVQVMEHWAKTYKPE
jgi:hypothetical protein